MILIQFNQIYNPSKHLLKMLRVLERGVIILLKWKTHKVKRVERTYVREIFAQGIKMSFSFCIQHEKNILSHTLV